jgi:putative ABC transport system permease protein
MLLLKLALRNIVANRLRSLVIYVSITLVATVLFLFLSFSDGEIENFTTGIEGLRTPPADLVLTHWDYLRARAAGETGEALAALTIRDFRDIAREAAAVPGVTAVYPVTVPVSAGIFAHGKRYDEIQYLGLDLGNDRHVRDRIHVTGGTYLTGATNGMLLHESMKDDIGIEIGDEVVVTGSTLFGQALAERFVVEGFYRARVDLPTIFKAIYTTLPGYDLISGYYDNEVPFLQVDLADPGSVRAMVAALREQLARRDPGVAVSPFGQLHEQSLAVYGAIRMILVSVTFLIVSVVMFGVMNVVSANLVDRGREIGTYYCLGASRRFLTALYALEIVLVNLCAAATGVALGIIVVWAVNALAWETNDVGLQMVLGGDRMRLGISVSSIAWILGMLVVVSGVTALFSLGRVLRVSPIEALRETSD